MGAVVLILASLIFIVNAAFLLGKIEDAKSVGASNLAVGVLIMIVAVVNGFTATSEYALVNAGLGMAFCLFYLMLAANCLGNFDFANIGWYCLGAGLYTAMATYFYFSVGDVIFGLFGLSWVVLFFVTFGSMALRKPWGKIVGWLLATEGIVTLLVPGFLLLIGKW